MKPSQRTGQRMILGVMGRAVSLLKDLPRSKYRPHQGKQEIARRKRQIADFKLTRSNGLLVFRDGAEI